MRRSEQINELAAALAKAQGAMKDAAKDRENPHFKSSYATMASVMDSVRGPLSSAGLAIMQDPSTSDGDVVVVTLLAHSSGQWVESEIRARPTKMDPQGIGSAITYLRRYAVMAVCGIAPTDDDDGEAAVKPATGKERAQARKTETPAAKAERQAKHDPSWPEDRGAFMIALKDAGLPGYDDLAAWQTSRGKPAPAEMAPGHRTAFVSALRDNAKGLRDELVDWLDANAVALGGAA